MTNKRVLEIIKKKIMTDYKEEVSLLVQYNTRMSLEEETMGLDFYFVPKSDSAHQLSTQFIIEGISYDLFPMGWNRLLKIAAMDSPQAYLILDSNIVYSPDEEALARFNQYRADLKKVLSGDYAEALLNKSFEYFNETYIYLYNMEHVATSLLDVKIESSKILSQLANALAFANNDYYKGGQGSEVSIIESSFKLTKLPESYQTLVENIIYSTDLKTLVELIHELIQNTRSFLHTQKLLLAQPEPFETFFVGYYEELKGIINRFKIALNHQDYIKLFSLASYIHEELSQFMMKVESGVWFDDRNVYSEYSQVFDNYFKVDLLRLISDKNDQAIQKSISDFESQFILLLQHHNINLLSFDSVETFEQYFSNK